MRTPGLGRPDRWGGVAGGAVLLAYGVLWVLMPWAAWCGLTAWLGG